MPSPGKRILWHVSAHGWGHAARQRELVRLLLEELPGTRITLLSDAPRWFWRNTPLSELLPGLPSPTAIERNGLPDRRLTALNLKAFLAREKELTKVLLDIQASFRPDLVISDIDPLPFRTASECSIPSIGISNFTWDWILREMCPDMAGEAAMVGEMYQGGTYLRLPMGPDHSPFGKTMETPLLRGGPPGDPARGKRFLPEGTLNCLAAFRQLPQSFPRKPPEGITVFSSLPEPMSEGWLNVHPDRLSEEGATFSDLVAAADAVVAKPGYGIVSQVLALGKPAVFLPKGAFPEERNLLEGIRDRPGIRILSGKHVAEAFQACQEVSEEPATPVEAPGGRLITERIIGILAGKSAYL